MNRIAKAIFAVLMLVAITTRLEAQTPYRQYADDGIVLNFHEIDNIDFRLFLLYNLSKDERFVLTPDHEYGLFTLNAHDEQPVENFFETFETFYDRASTDFGFIDKADLQDLVAQIRWLNLSNCVRHNLCGFDNYPFELKVAKRFY